tara:strand:+ start:11930 stop:12526 length:597 start_codon:yes stop_codon:yes gene_type:complete
MNSPSQIGNIVLPAQPPKPNLPKFPSLNLAEDTLPAHNATLQSFMAGSGPRPSGAFLPKLPVINVPRAAIGAENFQLALPTNHSVHETFGGSPRWEAEQMKYMPTNPRALSSPTKLKISAESRQVPIRDIPVLPKANMPNLPDMRNMVGKAEPKFVEARPVSPPVMNADLGGLLSSTSKYGNFGSSPGRAFGAEAFLY